MAKHKFDGSLQFAALPWRISEGGTRQIMLLTSRETHRWVIPKGWPMKGRKPAEVASQEAYEEAGLIGQVVGKRPLGNFHYEKRLAKRAIICEVRVFLFRVERQLDDWPEKGERESKWVDAEEVPDEALLDLIDDRSRIVVATHHACIPRMLIVRSDRLVEAVIIVTYAENGGIWDHVAPPKIDRWGPGTRVPTIIVSPFAKRRDQFG